MNSRPLASKRILPQVKGTSLDSASGGFPLDSALVGLEEALLQDVPEEIVECTRQYLEEQGVYNELATMVAQRATDLISNDFMAHHKVEPIMEALSVATLAVQSSSFHPQFDFFSMHASVMDKIIGHAEVEPNGREKLDHSAEEAYRASEQLAMIQDRFGSRVPAATLSFMENFFDKKGNPEEHGVPDMAASLKAIEYALGELARERKATDARNHEKDLAATALYDLTVCAPADDNLDDSDDDSDDDDDDDDDDEDPDIQPCVASLIAKNPPGSLDKAPVHKGEKKPCLAKEMAACKKEAIEMPPEGACQKAGEVKSEGQPASGETCKASSGS